HATAATSPQISAEGTRDAVRDRWEANLAEMKRFVPLLPAPAVHNRIAELARAYLAGREPLFSLRIEQGRIRDGHGDLLADDVYCLDTPRILDCLEFDDRLRSVDVVDDMSFLAMDLERLGAPEAARLLLDSYRTMTGDPYPESLRHHYTAYRAHVRAKVACLRHEQGDPEALGQAACLLDLAEDHLRAGRVALVLVGGLPGTGKSTLATMLADALGWALLRSDEVRKESDEVQAGGAPPEGSGYRQGRYAPESVEATYHSLLERARTLLAMGTPVILDASWTAARRRSEAAETARATASVLVPLCCTAPAQVAETRIEARLRTRREGGGDPSDATPLVARAMAADADPWPEAAAIDTSGSPDHALAQAEQELSRLLA
ncbi:MAG TPA: AAA family ATPase, partial [Actinomycetota bacterium]